VKDHVKIGLEILQPLQHLGDALHFIRDHHEHWDGGGYPHGRAGADITIGGRVLTAADAFDALTSKRAYRDPMTAITTLDYLATQAGRLLEPRVYEALRVVIVRGDVEGLPRVG
jgi:response regulator RpfG family c-di-GMP phosphodiesterase